MSNARDLSFLGNGPAFSAYKSGSNQTITFDTFTKVTFETERFDTNGNFASSRFTPTVPGYYQINSVLRFGATTITNAIALLYKNGSVYERGAETGVLSTSNTSLQTSSSWLVYLNGTTDYVEIFAYMSGTGTLQLTQVNNAVTCTFSGYLAKPD